ncbi:Ger(x)C family spore germination protein, partial [Alcanivoracaceae bacterium MT1]
ILDEVQLVTAVGYDLTIDNKIEATAVFPSYLVDNSVKNNTLTATANLSKDIRDKMDRMSSKPLVSGKIEVALYSEAFAEKGIINVLDTFIRDPTTGARMYLVVVEGDLKNELKIQYADTDNGMFLSNLIEHNIHRGFIPMTNLQIFTKTYYSEGGDPFLPLLTLSNGKVYIKGLALFKDDKYVGSLTLEENHIFKILLEPSTENTIQTVDLEDSSASIVNVSTNRKLTVKNPLTDPEINIKINTSSIVREYSGNNLSKEMINKIKEKMEIEIKTKSSEMIKQFQDLNIDPIRIGFYVKHTNRNWDKDIWYSLYPNAKVNIDVNVDITETGVIN